MTIEKTEINTNEIKVEDKSDIEKIIYISKTDEAETPSVKVRELKIILFN